MGYFLLTFQRYGYFQDGKTFGQNINIRYTVSFVINV